MGYDHLFIFTLTNFFPALFYKKVYKIKKKAIVQNAKKKKGKKETNKHK